MGPSSYIAQILAHDLHLGFPWLQGRFCPMVKIIANLPSSRSGKHALPFTGMIIYLTTIFIPSTGLEDVPSYTEALIKFTQQA